MVDTIVDNLTLRTQRRAFISLELNALTSHDALNQLINSIKNILSGNKDIENFSVVLSDISQNSFVVQVEYFTGTVEMVNFNGARQSTNLAIIELTENMKIKLAGKETEVIVTTGEKNADSENTTL